MTKYKPTVFKNYVKWYDEEDSSQNNETSIRKLLTKRLPYEVIIKNEKIIDLRDIGELTLGPWSAYSEVWFNIGHYFFAEEVDAMAFKLRWL